MLIQFGVGQLAVDAVDQAAEFAGVDEEGLFAAVAEAAFGGGVFLGGLAFGGHGWVLGLGGSFDDGEPLVMVRVSLGDGQRVG